MTLGSPKAPGALALEMQRHRCGACRRKPAKVVRLVHRRQAARSPPARSPRCLRRLRQQSPAGIDFQYIYTADYVRIGTYTGQVNSRISLRDLDGRVLRKVTVWQGSGGTTEPPACI